MPCSIFFGAILSEFSGSIDTRILQIPRCLYPEEEYGFISYLLGLVEWRCLTVIILGFGIVFGLDVQVLISTNALIFSNWQCILGIIWGRRTIMRGSLSYRRAIVLCSYLEQLKRMMAEWMWSILDWVRVTWVQEVPDRRLLIPFSNHERVIVTLGLPYLISWTHSSTTKRLKSLIPSYY